MVFVSQEQVGHEVNILLSLKKSYESLTGAAWKSSTAWNAPPPGPTGGAPGGAEGKGSEVTDGAGLRAGVDAQGLIVRQLKAAGAPKVGARGDLTGFNRIAIHFPCVGS